MVSWSQVAIHIIGIAMFMYYMLFNGELKLALTGIMIELVLNTAITIGVDG